MVKRYRHLILAPIGSSGRSGQRVRKRYLVPADGSVLRKQQAAHQGAWPEIIFTHSLVSIDDVLAMAP